MLPAFKLFNFPAINWIFSPYVARVLCLSKLMGYKKTSFFVRPGLSSDWLSECLYLQLGRYFLIGCCEHYGSLWRPTYKRSHSVAVNTAWFSSRLHVEAWKQPDLRWLGVAMAMSLLLLNCLHVTLFFFLLHGEFHVFCCELYSFLVCRLIFRWKQRWLRVKMTWVWGFSVEVWQAFFERSCSFMSLCLRFLTWFSMQ